MAIFAGKTTADLSLFYEIHYNNLAIVNCYGFYLAIVNKNRYLSEAGGGSRRTGPHPFQYHHPNAYRDGFKNTLFPGQLQIGTRDSRAVKKIKRLFQHQRMLRLMDCLPQRSSCKYM